ncbi:ribonuclease H-like domain-containing protein [Tanacetum coccineum]
MVAIDGAGFDRSYMADDKVPTNMALMPFSDSKVHNDKTYSKTFLKSFETLKTQLDDLRIEFNKSEFNLANYKRGLASIEEQLVFYKKNEVIFCEQLDVLKRDISYKDSEISMLKSELEKLKQEKESNQLKIENFDNASKSLYKLIRSQIPDKSRKSVGFLSYNDVLPPLIGLFSPLKFDLSNSGLEEFQQPEFEGYGPTPSKSFSEDTSNEVRESPDALGNGYSSKGQEESQKRPNQARDGKDKVKSKLKLVKESVDAAIVAKRARHTNAGKDARGYGPVRGQDSQTLVFESSLLPGFMKGQEKTVNQMPWTEMKQLMTAEFYLIEELQRMEHERWNLKVKEYNIVAYTQRFNELALMCPSMDEPKSVKVDAYIRGLTDNIKGEVTSSKLINLNEAVCMAHKLMEQKSQARDERILEGKK